MRASQLVPFLVNQLWVQSNQADYNRFVRSLENPELAQRQYLKNLLQKNAVTSYGLINHFSQLASLQDFQKNVPLTQYEDYLPYIEDISKGKPRVLTIDPVVLFQPTSGTSSASKLIPYTKSLHVEYQRAIAAWIFSLYRRVPEIMGGRAYWSISPATQSDGFHGGIPVGFDDDSKYLGALGKRFYDLVSVGQNKFITPISLDGFWEQTLINLLKARNLTLISVWSPTFLLILVKQFANNWDHILEVLTNNDSRGRTRASECQRIIQKEGLNFEGIWPNLKLISCWTHGASESYISEVRKYFPNVEIQGKGLVSTEAFVSLPLLRDKDPALAINSHFFEFKDVENGEILLAHNLRRGNIYSVIVTTGGGFYRYELNDLVKITGVIKKTPTLRFISKNAVSDLFGEKLNFEFVQRSVEIAFAAGFIKPTFSLVAPVKIGDQKTAYTLFFSSGEVVDTQIRMLGEKLENLLQENFHYSYCRQLGQLESLKVFLIDPWQTPPEAIYMREMNRRGQRLGDIKPSILDRETGWEKRFPGQFRI